MILAQRKPYSYPKVRCQPVQSSVVGANATCHLLQFPTRETLLIPIRLDIDIEGYRYIDSFSWNLYVRYLFSVKKGYVAVD